jgi:lipid A 3-O-deacylase
MRYFICLHFFLFAVLLNAQDTVPSADSAKTNDILRIYYQNDFYTHTDYYFTQGEQVEYIHPVFDRFFLKNILLGQANTSFSQTGIAYYGGGYTPKHLDSTNIQAHDRPFAAYLYFGYFLETVSAKKDLFIRSEISLGSIGPSALGKPTQIFIHDQLGMPTPMGWDNQVSNDLVAQYSINADKLLFSILKVPALWLQGKMDIGTMRDNLTIGMKLDAEPLQNVFGKAKRKFFFAPFAGVYATTVGYDAMMQGGMFNHDSPHVFAPEQVEKLVTKGNAGIKLRYKKMQLNFCLEFISPEFKGGSPHSWGNTHLIFYL